MKLALGFFWVMAVLGILGVVLVSSDPARRTQRETADTAPNSRWRKLREEMERNEKFITASSTILIAVFTIALAIATFFLWLATRNLVQDAKETSEKQLRAYIGIQSNETTVYPFEFGGFAFIAHAELRNFGQTPAYDLVVQSNAAIDMPDAVPFNDTQSHAQTAAGASIAFRDAGVHVNVGWPISEEEKNALRNRKKFVFFWGTAKYRDTFGKRHSFTFRLVSGQIAVGTGGVYVMGPHPMGYEGD